MRPRVPAHARARHPGRYGTLGDPHMPPHARHGHLVAGNRHDAWEVLPSVAAPTLVLHGDQDRLTPPENAPLLAERIPDARVHLLPAARHAYFEECRDTAGAPVRAFLA
ncbi:alpha/beta fold hydrolase [Streptomyces sp. NBC_00111]|uniref:alpha/beta fold hydrolase n=1 Tax=Streptomyces sp. NBC_00111 TaxID=2975655 RepID=UPI0038638A9C